MAVYVFETERFALLRVADADFEATDPPTATVIPAIFIFILLFLISTHSESVQFCVVLVKVNSLDELASFLQHDCVAIEDKQVFEWTCHLINHVFSLNPILTRQRIDLRPVTRSSVNFVSVLRILGKNYKSARESSFIALLDNDDIGAFFF